MKILVTGSEGFVSRHLCKALHDKGHTVHGVDKVEQGKHSYVDTFYHKDLSDLKSHNSSWLEKYDVIYHLAAETGLGASGNWLKAIDLFWEANTKATLNLVKYSDPSKFVFTSTAALYGEGDMFKETDSLRCNNGYGFSKAVAETIVQGSEFDYCIFRPGTIVGLYGRSVLNRFTWECAKGKTSKVFNQGHNKRCFVDVEDVVSALLVAKDLNGVYNLCTDEVTKIGDILEVITKMGRNYGCLYSYNRVSDCPSGLAKTVTLDNSKLMKTGKWTPKHNIGGMVKRLFDHYVNDFDAVEPQEWR